MEKQTNDGGRRVEEEKTVTCGYKSSYKFFFSINRGGVGEDFGVRDVRVPSLTGRVRVGLLLYKVHTTLDELAQCLTFEHAVTQEGKVDELVQHLVVLGEV